MINIAIFASGTGSNAYKIIDYFKNHSSIQVSLIITNNSQAGVIQIAKDNHIPYEIINKKNIDDATLVISTLDKYAIHFIVLAGFMLLIPSYLSNKYAHKMINIHPALLPKYGGLGMYGSFVHEAVFKNKEKESGISIHFVNEHYDEGKIIFQKSVNIESCVNAQEVGKAVLQLEHENYAKIIEATVMDTLQ